MLWAGWSGHLGTWLLCSGLCPSRLLAGWLAGLLWAAELREALPFVPQGSVGSVLFPECSKRFVHDSRY